jgi:hypothetical protein
VTAQDRPGRREAAWRPVLRKSKNPKRGEATHTLGAKAGVSNAVEIKTRCPSGTEHPASQHSTAH